MVGDISTVGGYGEERRREGRGGENMMTRHKGTMNGMEELVDLIMRYDTIRYKRVAELHTVSSVSLLQ